MILFHCKGEEKTNKLKTVDILKILKVYLQPIRTIHLSCASGPSSHFWRRHVHLSSMFTRIKQNFAWRSPKLRRCGWLCLYLCNKPDVSRKRVISCQVQNTEVRCVSGQELSHNMVFPCYGLKVQQLSLV